MDDHPVTSKRAKADTNRIAALMRARAVGSVALYGLRHPASSGVVHKMLDAAPVPAKRSPS